MQKTYHVTVEGKTYEVTLEEVGSANGPVTRAPQAFAPVAPVAPATPKPAAAPAAPAAQKKPAEHHAAASGERRAEGEGDGGEGGADGVFHCSFL